MRIAASFAALLVAALTLGGCATTAMSSKAARDAGIATGFINKSMTVGDEERAYVVYVPRNYNPVKKWPLIVFLHGAGERGKDGMAQTEVGIGTSIRRHVAWFSCLVLMPQCPSGKWWDAAVADIDAALAQTLDEYTIDLDHITLTGLSMGGFAAWMYGAANAGRFAALMPICGGGNVEDAADLAEMPIWAFHGADDPVVPPQKSRDMVEAVEAAGGRIRYTEYEGVGHDSWVKAYDERGAIQWLLKQRRGKT